MNGAGLSQYKKGKMASGVIFFVLVYISTIALWNYYLGSMNPFRILFFGLLMVEIGLFFVSTKKFVVELSGIGFTFYTLYVISWSLLSDYGTAFEKLYIYLFLPLTFFGFIYITRRCELVKICNIVSLFCTLVGLLAIVEYTANIYIIPKLVYSGVRSRVFSDSCLTLGCQLAVGVIISLLMYKITSRKLFLIEIVICGLGLLCTGSRGPLVGCIIAAFVFIYLTEKELGSRRKAILFLVVTLVIVFLGSYLLSTDRISIDKSHHFLYRAKSIFDWETDVDNVSRVYKWTTYLEIFTKKPIVGYGPGYCISTQYGVTESGVIQRLVEIGILGSLFYYTFVIGLIINTIKSLKALTPKDALLSVGLLSASICIFVEDFVLQVFESTIVSTLLYLLLAMLTVIRTNNRFTEDSNL